MRGVVIVACSLAGGCAGLWLLSDWVAGLGGRQSALTSELAPGVISVILVGAFVGALLGGALLPPRQ